MSELKNIVNYTKALKTKTYVASLYSILNKIFDLAPPILIGMAVDIVVKKEASFLARFGYKDPFEQIITLAVLTVIIWGLESFFEYLYKVAWRSVAQELQHLLRQDTYNHVQSLDMNYFEEKNSGQLISIISDDVNQLERFLNDGANSILQVLTTVLFVGCLFFILAPSVAVFSFLPIPIILMGSFVYQKKLQPLYREVRERVGLINETLVNNFLGIATIKSYTAENYESTKLMEMSRDYCRSNEKAIVVSSAFSPLIRMAVVLGFIATLVVGGKLTLNGQMEVGVYSVLVFMTQRLLWPLTGLGETFDMYQRSMASAQRIFNLLKVPVKIISGSMDQFQPKGHVHFRQVNFRYKDSPPLLKSVHFEVLPGSSIAIVGATGSGKSTIVKLLNRFYDIESGEIRIDGKNIVDLDLRVLRSTLSFVSQESYLFHGTVRENIVYGQSQVSEESLQKAIQDSECQGFIGELPQGLETLIGERGQKLSGGQRQRISIARALLKDAPILILDEATSAVDNETEAAIQRAIEKVSQSKTLIIIAHRLSTIVNSNEIVVLDKGQIVQRGRHENLIETDGIYKRLWAVQTGLK